MDTTDREPSITSIKTKLADVNQKIKAYKTAIDSRYTASRLDPADVRVYGNNGTVTCNKYCHGNISASWNNELPRDWLGAQCVSAGANNQFGCGQPNVYDSPPATVGGAGLLQCVCRRNDAFPYSTSAYGDSTLPPTMVSPLDDMRDAIVADFNAINLLINQILPVTDANKTLADASVLTFLNEYQQLNDNFNVLVAELKKPMELDASYEVSHIKTESNFDHYILYMVGALFFVGSLIYILINPEVGNLDLFILALAILILAYHLYVYISQKIRQK
jgi:hypothetical protein